MRFAFRWGIYGAWPALSKAAPSVLLQTVYLVPRMKMRQHRAIMAYCMRCKFLLCAFISLGQRGKAARRLAVPTWLRACGRRRGRTVSPVCESENSRLSSAQDGALTFIWRAAGCGQSRARLRHARAPACRAAPALRRFSRFWPYIPRPMPTWRPEPASGFAPVLSGCIPPAAAPLRTHGG